MHNCIETSDRALDQSFGPVRLRISPQSAKNPVSEKSKGTVIAMCKLIGLLLRERISGAYKKTQFFHVKSGMPIVVPHVLSKQEWQAVRDKLE